MGASGATLDPCHLSPPASFCTEKRDEPPQASFFMGNEDRQDALKAFWSAVLASRSGLPHPEKQSIEVGQNPHSPH